MEDEGVLGGPSFLSTTEGLSLGPCILSIASHPHPWQPAWVASIPSWLERRRGVFKGREGRYLILNRCLKPGILLLLIMKYS